MILEVSQYLENYLWLNFDPGNATFEHVMSMIFMVNEKFRENVAAWGCFYDRKDTFKGFLERVLRLKEGRELSIAEKTNYLVFMINAFQRDVPARYLLRLGQGEQELATDLDFSRQGRVNAMLVRRSLQLPEDVGYTCETAGYFWLLHVYSRWEQFLAACAENKDKPSFVRDRFPSRSSFLTLHIRYLKVSLLR
ncbi:putative intron-binding protein aquarius [Lupinus albus]|uniref:Putative intron-binding protein aquarius n=1 Tax=Lupinus albus TaxID=3870 RepID=A0A6A4PUY5_LUPAL|nr:putative intron-binding protein aquarius [Lupinus albus]